MKNRLKRSPTTLRVFFDDGASLLGSIGRHPPTHDHSSRSMDHDQGVDVIILCHCHSSALFSTKALARYQLYEQLW